MKKVLLAGASLMALLAAAPAASGATVTFDYTGKIVSYVAPENGAYQIVAFGAQGGNTGRLGGLGTKVFAEVELTKGETLQIAVGGAGQSDSNTTGGGGGGGGGSFVVGPGNQALVVAGGGGGAGNPGDAGNPGQAGADGGNGNGTLIHRGDGGSSGAGGEAGGYGGGGGGGGFKGNGERDSFSNYGGYGGGGFAAGLEGGRGDFSNGGFGGGGGGGNSYKNGNSNGLTYGFGGGGGGGGYSGGGGGESEIDQPPNSYYGGGGGGGGSFVDGTALSIVPGVRSGNGEIDITEVAGGPAVPEPSTWAMMAAGFAALGLTGLRRRRKI
jgi:hypothetical protein